MLSATAHPSWKQGILVVIFHKITKIIFNSKQKCLNLDYVSKHWFIYKSSHQRSSVLKSVLRNLAKFTWKHLCQSIFFNKVAGLKALKREYIFSKYSRNLNISVIFWTCYTKNNFPIIFSKYKKPHFLTSNEI